jgi:hypothetical protein
MSTSLERYFEMMTSKLQGSRGLHECNGVACPFWCRVPLRTMEFRYELGLW